MFAIICAYLNIYASMTCKLIFGMGQTLVLNASYEPLNITSWRRAVILMIKGKGRKFRRRSIIPHTFWSKTTYSY